MDNCTELKKYYRWDSQLCAWDEGLRLSTHNTWQSGGSYELMVLLALSWTAGLHSSDPSTFMATSSLQGPSPIA